MEVWPRRSGSRTRLPNVCVRTIPPSVASSIQPVACGSIAIISPFSKGGPTANARASRCGISGCGPAVGVTRRGVEVSETCARRGRVVEGSGVGAHLAVVPTVIGGDDVARGRGTISSGEEGRERRSTILRGPASPRSTGHGRRAIGTCIFPSGGEVERDGGSVARGVDGGGDGGVVELAPWMVTVLVAAPERTPTEEARMAETACRALTPGSTATGSRPPGAREYPALSATEPAVTEPEGAMARAEKLAGKATPATPETGPPA